MSKKGKIIWVLTVVLCAALLTAVYFAFGKSGKTQPAQRPDTAVTDTAEEVQEQQVSKNIIITVAGPDGESTSYELATKAEYLSQAMEDAQGLTFSGSYGPYGIMLEVVNGVSAVYEEDGAYWSVLVDGEYGMHGIDTQLVQDGVEYTLVYTLA